MKYEKILLMPFGIIVETFKIYSTIAVIDFLIEGYMRLVCFNNKFNITINIFVIVISVFLAYINNKRYLNG